VRARIPAVGASPVPEIAAGAARYRQVNGFLAPEQDYSRSVIPPSQTRAMGAAYGKLPDFDPGAVPAYHQMGEEVGRQFDHMTKPRSKGGMGIDVSVQDSDPYGAAGFDGPDGWKRVMPEMRNDVMNNSHMGVLSTRSTGGHPFFSNDQNDMFRAVHDTFGHLAAGRGVDRHGEEAAYQKHSAMFSPLARGALATETRGQNSALHYNGGAFQDQKVAIMPSRFQAPRNLHSLQFGEMAGAHKQAIEKNQDQGL
jgi:hypothetical protein